MCGFLIFHFREKDKAQQSVDLVIWKFAENIVVEPWSGLRSSCMSLLAFEKGLDYRIRVDILLQCLGGLAGSKMKQSRLRKGERQFMEVHRLFMVAVWRVPMLAGCLVGKLRCDMVFAVVDVESLIAVDHEEWWEIRGWILDIKFRDRLDCFIEQFLFPCFELLLVCFFVVFLAWATSTNGGESTKDIAVDSSRSLGVADNVSGVVVLEVLPTDGDAFRVVTRVAILLTFGDANVASSHGSSTKK